MHMPNQDKARTDTEPSYEKIRQTVNEKETVKDSEDCLTDGEAELNVKTDEASCSSVSVQQSPTAHIYQTLDKYLGSHTA